MVSAFRRRRVYVQRRLQWEKILEQWLAFHSTIVQTDLTRTLTLYRLIVVETADVCMFAIAHMKDIPLWCLHITLGSCAKFVLCFGVFFYGWSDCACTYIHIYV